MSLFVDLLQLNIYVHTAYVYYEYIYLREYLIGFFNWNLARICQEVASPFALFLMWFISTRAKKYAQPVGGIWSYIQRYIPACVCVTRLSVVKCQTRVFFLIGKVKGESTVCLGMRSRSRSRRRRHVCDTERENWELRTDLAFANCWKCQSKLRNSTIHNSRISSKTS